MEATFPAAPPKIPYVGFSHGTASSIRHLAVRSGAFRVPPLELRPTPPCLHGDPRLLQPSAASVTVGDIRLNVRSPASTPPPEPRGPRSGWVMLSHPSSLGDLIRQSAAPPHFPATPVIATVFGIQGSSCLLPRPSGLSLLYFPELPPSASAGSSNTCASVLPYRHWPSGRYGKPLATPRCPRISFMRAQYFGVSFVRSRYGPPGCSPPALTRPERLCVLSASRGFYFRAFRSPGRPVCLPEITTASN